MSIQRIVTSEIFDPNIQFQQKQLVELTVVDEQSSSPDNALMLNQTFDVIEEQNNAVQEEFAITLKQSQNTILNLQNAQQALLLENAQSRAQITVLESQNNQMNAAHQADMRAALERNKTLEEALAAKSNEVYCLEKKAKLLAIHEEGFTAVKNATEQLTPQLNLNCGYMHLLPTYGAWHRNIAVQIAETDRKLQEAKGYFVKTGNQENKAMK